MKKIVIATTKGGKEVSVYHCPHCGKNEQTLEPDDYDNHYVRCEYCGARGGECSTQEQAVIEWNKRDGVALAKRFFCNTVKWFDKVNGNTYHSNCITVAVTGEVVHTPFTYGYGDHYRTTALYTLFTNGYIPKKYEGKLYLFERENDYPIVWNVSHGLKRDCKANGGE